MGMPVQINLSLADYPTDFLAQTFWIALREYYSLFKLVFIMSRKGLTLIELIITIVMFAILIVVTTYVFRVILLSWSSQETRAGIDISLYRGVEEMVRDLREAKGVNTLNSDEIRFTQDQTTFYILYFYNANDSYPPSFDQATYELKKATLSGSISGTFTYGDGQIIVTGVVPPPTSDLSLSGNIVTIDLSITRRDETMRTRTEVGPRNL